MIRQAHSPVRPQRKLPLRGLGSACLFLAALLMSYSAWAGSGPEPALGEILRHEADAAERFWSAFPDVDSTERVLQTKLDPKGKILYQQESQYDYLILVGANGDEFGVNESRLLQKQEGKTKNIPLLITNGFSMMVLIFHPWFQNSFEFTRLPDETVEGETLMRLRFRHIRGTRSPSALQLRGRTYPLEWEGTAWLDPRTWAVHRVEAGLAEPMDDVGLHELRCDVRYAPVQFSTASEVYWLPQTAEVEAQTPRQHWRNVHQFTDYKRFSTDAKERPRSTP